MLIRITSIACLSLALVFILYLPSAHPPERFLEQLRAEHDLSARFWGAQHALRIMARMLALYESGKTSNSVPPAFVDAPATSQVNAVVITAMSQVTGRLFQNQYFRAIETLFVLATYRLAALLECLPIVAAFVAAGCFDGLVGRAVKARQFQHHNPEVFALCVAACIMVLCGTFVMLVVPLTVHPVLWAAAPCVVGFFCCLAIANFHHRG